METNCVTAINYSDKTEDLLQHFHTGMEFIYITKGEIELTIQGAVYTAGKDSLILLNNLEEHRIRVLQPVYHRYFLLLNNLNTRQMLSNPALSFLLRNGPSRILQLTGEMQEQALWIFRRLLAERKTQDTFSQYQTNSLINALFILVYRAEHVNPDTGIKLPPELDVVAQIQDYIDGHFAEDLKIAQISQMFYMSKYYISHLFRDSTGHTVKEYLTAVRLTHARQLLTATQDKINEVCFQCGFNDVNRFISAFRSAYGCTPLQYRKQFEQTMQ